MMARAQEGPSSRTTPSIGSRLVNEMMANGRSLETPGRSSAIVSLQRFTSGSLTTEENGDWLPALSATIDWGDGEVGRVPVPFSGRITGGVRKTGTGTRPAWPAGKGDASTRAGSQSPSSSLVRRSSGNRCRMTLSGTCPIDKGPFASTPPRQPSILLLEPPAAVAAQPLAGEDLRRDRGRLRSRGGADEPGVARGVGLHGQGDVGRAGMASPLLDSDPEQPRPLRPGEPLARGEPVGQPIEPASTRKRRAARASPRRLSRPARRPGRQPSTRRATAIAADRPPAGSPRSPTPRRRRA